MMNRIGRDHVHAADHSLRDHLESAGRSLSSPRSLRHLIKMRLHAFADISAGFGGWIQWEARMTDAFFWYTGLVFWILVAVATVSLLAAEGCA